MSRSSLAESLIRKVADKLNSTPAEYIPGSDKTYDIEKVELKWITSLASGQEVPELALKLKDRKDPVKFATYGTIFNAFRFIKFKEVPENGYQS